MDNQKIKFDYSKTAWIVLFLLIFNSNQLSGTVVIRTRLSSEVAGQEGLAIRIDIPQHQRYDTGSPVVIYMAGGFQSEGLDERSTGLDTLGFIEIRFNFPGGGSKDPKVFSEDIFSFRRITLAPIILFIGFVFEIYAIMKKPKEEK